MNQPSLSASALSDARLGLFRGSDFVIPTGRISNSAVIDKALWYFRDEVIAVPRAGLPVAGYTTGVTAMQDIVDWARSHNSGAPIDYPPLLWIAARDIVHGARLSSNGSRINGPGGDCAFGVVPKIPLNRSYYNEASVAFFAARSTTIRGHSDGERFIARTIWPNDFRLDFAAPVRRIEATPLALRALAREHPRGGAQSPFTATALWERDPDARDWTDKPVLAIVLNGAQGDDDEAHGGHFALTTGYVGRDGAIGDWIANNFYTLDS
ncbi:MAG TPA: hypothetical protein VKG21_08825, partial [Casimicrobiaceae bacterium]|nr:hypothetical protein [Casimicrobiaceae bacterium]